MSDTVAYRINAIPSDLDRRQFLSHMMNRQFVICHNLGKNETSFIFGKKGDEISQCQKMGIGMAECSLDFKPKKMKSIAFSPVPDADEHKLIDLDFPDPLAEIYEVLGGLQAELFLVFTPASGIFIERLKGDVERKLSMMDVRITKNAGAWFNRKGDSMHADIYYDSDDRRFLSFMLDMLNEAVLSNGTAYKITALLETGEQSQNVLSYLKSSLLILDESDCSINSIDDVLNLGNSESALPFPYSVAARFIDFSSSIKRENSMVTMMPEGTGDIEIGRYLKNGIGVTGSVVKIDQSVFNLGTIITGLPGTGKTTTAMAVMNQLRNTCRPYFVIISPNEEWNGFAIANGLRVINPYTTGSKINFFKCDAGINIEQFYENLAMLIASASNAGPYRNSIEKCLLAAFSKIYNSTRVPDPQEVYWQIEDENIEQHGRKTNAGVKYTKHGENIKASLEDLRLMLMKPQFAYKEGIDFEDLLDKGVVFDLSSVSNKMKPLFYALILNQIYSFADGFDAFGEGRIRLVLCLEEAQLVFGGGDTSTAAIDLGQRIQNFRKRGISLVLITHNAASIDQNIRRLCQNKIYFRQSADVAKYVANDMIFDELLYPKVVEKLKTLKQFTCALTYMNVSGRGKAPESSIFVLTSPYFVSYGDREKPGKSARSRELISMSIKLADRSGVPMANTKVELSYLGERIFRGKTDGSGVTEVANVLNRKWYRLVVLDETGRKLHAVDLECRRVTEVKLAA